MKEEKTVRFGRGDDDDNRLRQRNKCIENKVVREVDDASGIQWVLIHALIQHQKQKSIYHSYNYTKIYHHHHCSSNETWVSCVQVWLHNLFCHYQHGNPLFPSAELNHTVNIAHSLYFCYFILLVVGKLKYGTCNYNHFWLGWDSQLKTQKIFFQVIISRYLTHTTTYISRVIIRSKKFNNGTAKQCNFQQTTTSGCLFILQYSAVVHLLLFNFVNGLTIGMQKRGLCVVVFK